MYIIFAAGDRLRDTAHAQWLCLITQIWSNSVIHITQ